MSESTRNELPRSGKESLYEYIREDLQAILEGPGVTWDKKGIMAAYDKAAARAMVRYARANGLEII